MSVLTHSPLWVWDGSVTSMELAMLAASCLPSFGIIKLWLYPWVPMKTLWGSDSVRSLGLCGKHLASLALSPTPLTLFTNISLRVLMLASAAPGLYTSNKPQVLNYGSPPLLFAKTH